MGQVLRVKLLAVDLSTAMPLPVRSVCIQAPQPSTSARTCQVDCIDCVSRPKLGPSDVLQSFETIEKHGSHFGYRIRSVMVQPWVTCDDN